MRLGISGDIDIVLWAGVPPDSNQPNQRQIRGRLHAGILLTVTGDVAWVKLEALHMYLGCHQVPLDLVQ